MERAKLSLAGFLIQECSKDFFVAGINIFDSFTYSITYNTYNKGHYDSMPHYFSKPSRVKCQNRHCSEGLLRTLTRIYGTRYSYSSISRFYTAVNLTTRKEPVKGEIELLTN